jgi:hypothetical protein
MKIARRRAFRMVGWIAAYVLALHTMLFALASGAPHDAIAGVGPGAELCLTSTYTAGDRGSAPDREPQEHCKACFATGGPVAPATNSQPIVYAFAVALHIHASALVPRASACFRPGLPRAPPSLA